MEKTPNSKAAPLEVEMKFPVDDFDGVRGTLHRLGADLKGARFERNEVLDDPERSLAASRTLLRLRSDGRNIVTLKTPPKGAVPEGLKVMVERESEVADLGEMRAVFAALGYAPVFFYEKLRETWLLDGVAVCLDELPFGRFVELEAGGEEIYRAADRLGLDRKVATSKNYHQINRRFRQSRGLPPCESFVFDEADRTRLMKAANH